MTSKKIKSPINNTIVHYTENYLINPAHPITINIIGVGGTGSQVLNSLARMDSALKALGHPGFFVRAYDADKVTEANMGRQLFSPSDVGMHKCIVLVGRVNRFFGSSWEAVPENFNFNSYNPANITISCVDSGPARKEIKKIIGLVNHHEPFEKEYYWMDYGNTMDCGQVVIGTLRTITQPKSDFITSASLPTIEKLHPEIFRKTKDQGPSCSLAEALNKQDLFINTNLANMGLGILWKMFREAHIKYHGLYVNLDNCIVNPIKIK